MASNIARKKLNDVWRGMRRRCYVTDSQHYHRYGGRGIYICEQWRTSFETFYQWAIASGWQDGLTIDRTDNDGPYSPENCRFVTQAVNKANRIGSRSRAVDGLRPANGIRSGTGFYGVKWNYRRTGFQARISVDGREIHLGSFKTAEDAARARDAAAIKYLGDKVALNFPVGK